MYYKSKVLSSSYFFFVLHSHLVTFVDFRSHFFCHCSFLHFFFSHLTSHLSTSCTGMCVHGRLRDFRSPTSCTIINSSDVVLFEGILVFYFPEIRDLFNMRLFVDTDPDIRLSRRGSVFNIMFLHAVLNINEHFQASCGKSLFTAALDVIKLYVNLHSRDVSLKISTEQLFFQVEQSKTQHIFVLLTNILLG